MAWSGSYTRTKQIRSERKAKAQAEDKVSADSSLDEKISRLPSEGSKKERARLLKLKEKASKS